MRFGVTVPNYRRQASVENLVKVARRSEELGFDSVWVTDHVVVPEPYREMFGATVFDPLSVLAFLAGQTRRVMLGTAVLVLPYRNPLVVAKALATIDNLADGRLVFGVGAGWAREEFEALGVDYAARGPMTDEYLQAILELWTNPRPSFAGRFVNFHDVHAGPLPVHKPHPPVLVGGSSKRAIRRVVAFGDGWLPDGMSLPDLARGIGYMRDQAHLAGRDPAALSVYMRTGLRLFELSGNTPTRRLPAPWEQSTDFGAPTERQPFSGTFDQVAEDIHTAEAMGVDHLIFESPVQRGDERFDTLEAFAHRLLPEFKRGSGVT